MMAFLSPWDLAAICGGYWHLDHVPSTFFKGAKINSLDIDSNELFFALKGANKDGHDFVTRLKPPAAAVVEQPVSIALVPQLIVPSTQDALQRLAHAFACETDAVKIAITGSVGKTGTKEMLAGYLSQFDKTHANIGNLNNHLGVPLTLLSIPRELSYLVTEMGMNHKGEIAPLSQMVRPDIAIITKIAESHIGYLKSIEAVAKEKAKICAGLSPDGCLIIPRDDACYPLLKKAAQKANIKHIISFGRHQKSTVQLLSRTVNDTGKLAGSQIISFAIEDNTYSFTLGMRAEHWAINALSVIAADYFIGLDINQIFTALKQQGELEGRGVAIELSINSHPILLIDDAYNASPSSLKAAIADAANRPQPNKMFVFSDMLELEEFSDKMHFDLVPEILKAQPSCVVLIGAAMKQLKVPLQHISTLHVFDTLDQAKLILPSLVDDADIILVKGSHGSGAHLLVQFLKSLSDKEIANVI